MTTYPLYRWRPSLGRRWEKNRASSPEKPDARFYRARLAKAAPRGRFFLCSAAPRGRQGDAKGTPHMAHAPPAPCQGDGGRIIVAIMVSFRCFGLNVRQSPTKWHFFAVDGSFFVKMAKKRENSAYIGRKPTVKRKKVPLSSYVINTDMIISHECTLQPRQPGQPGQCPKPSLKPHPSLHTSAFRRTG